ncbi:MAG: hypothetical protein J0H67_14510 [Rhodospirillales bacterium]|nr:hypothetical protein [Rhodospirillales bacterium]
MNRKARPAHAAPPGTAKRREEDAATERAVQTTVTGPASQEQASQEQGQAGGAPKPDAEGRDTTAIEQAAAGAGRLDTA